MSHPPVCNAGEPLEDMGFHGSPDTTLGVELELQILDHSSGDLAPGATRILQCCEEDQIEGVSAEFFLSTVEVKTGVCSSVAEVRDTLVPRLRLVRNIARSLGYDLALGGTHPFARPTMSAVYPDERYQRIQKLQGWGAFQEVIFGLHVHVGVPDGESAIGVMNLLTPYLPHLLALSANSPFWQGVDTDYASARMRMFKPSANSGMPPHFESWQEFRRYCQVIHETGAIASTKDLYWDIRPRPGLGTVEFRICDIPSTLAGVSGIAALTRCLVADALRSPQSHPRDSQATQESFWIANENRWRAARFGLKAECARHPGGPRLSLADDVMRLLAELRPLAQELGEEPFLNLIDPASESDGDRQRHIYRQTGDWHAVLEDMKNRWAAEIDGAEAAPAAASVSDAPPKRAARRARTDAGQDAKAPGNGSPGKKDAKTKARRKTHPQ